MSIIAAGTTTTTALSSTGNTDGTLQFQVNGTTASVTLNTLGAVGVGSSPNFGTSGQVLTSGGSTVAPTWTTLSVRPTLGTPVNTTSGTSIDITGIPSGVRQITVMFSGVSIDATSTSAIVQLGDSGGIETNDYLGAYTRAGGAINTQFTSGFVVFDSTNTAFTYQGLLILNLQNSSTNTWAGSSVLAMSNAAQTALGAGTKALTGVLDRIRLTTLSGTAAFDAGQINISYF
jgi:hypothetical protein